MKQTQFFIKQKMPNKNPWHCCHWEQWNDCARHHKNSCRSIGCVQTLREITRDAADNRVRSNETSSETDVPDLLNRLSLQPLASALLWDTSIDWLRWARSTAWCVKRPSRLSKWTVTEFTVRMSSRRWNMRCLVTYVSRAAADFFSWFPAAWSATEKYQYNLEVVSMFYIVQIEPLPMIIIDNL